MAAIEKETVSTKQVYCDGGVGPLGHPRIYLEIGETGSVECPYCSKLFKYKES